MEDIVQTSLKTGPRGALRLAQGVQVAVGVGSEWLADLSKVWHLNLFYLSQFLFISVLIYEVLVDFFLTT